MSTQTEAIIWFVGGLAIIWGLMAIPRRWRGTIEADDMMVKTSFDEYGFHDEKMMTLPKEIASILDDTFKNPWIIAAGKHLVQGYMAEAWVLYPQDEPQLRKRGLGSNTIRRLTKKFQPRLLLRFQLSTTDLPTALFTQKKELPTFHHLPHKIANQKLHDFIITSGQPSLSLLDNHHIVSALKDRSWCDVLIQNSTMLVASIPYAYTATPPADYIQAPSILNPVSVTPWAEAREAIRLIQALEGKFDES